MIKYVVIKRDPSDNRVYIVQLGSDYELVEHVRGTVENTNHEIISVTRVAD